MNLLIINVICLFLLVNTKDLLHFNNDGYFKIAQFTDLHYGEGESESWGPIQDKQSYLMMSKIIKSEININLAVFTGDLITGNNIYSNATDYWSIMLQAVNETSTQFATIFGNHDDMPLESSSHLSLQNIISKEEIYQYESTTYPDLSYTQSGPSDIHGVSNYYLEIYPFDSDEKPAFILYFLDSNGGQLPEQLYSDETDWLAETNKELYDKYSANIPSFVFVHIPPPEYVNAYVPLSQSDTPCVGNIDLDGIDTTIGDNNLLSTVLSFNDTCRGISVGHDHQNDWLCPYQSLYLMYGRHSGYGGYSNVPRGSRMFNIYLNNTARDGVTIETWIRMEDGRIINSYFI